MTTPFDDSKFFNVLCYNSCWPTELEAGKRDFS